MFLELGQGTHNKEDSITLTLWWDILYKLSCVRNDLSYTSTGFLVHGFGQPVSVEHIVLLMERRENSGTP